MMKYQIQRNIHKYIIFIWSHLYNFQQAVCVLNNLKIQNDIDRK